MKRVSIIHKHHQTTFLSDGNTFPAPVLPSSCKALTFPIRTVGLTRIPQFVSAVSSFAHQIR